MFKVKSRREGFVPLRRKRMSALEGQEEWEHGGGGSNCMSLKVKIKEWKGNTHILNDSFHT